MDTTAPAATRTVTAINVGDAYRLGTALTEFGTSEVKPISAHALRHRRLPVIFSQLEVATYVEHARSVVGDDTCLAFAARQMTETLAREAR